MHSASTFLKEVGVGHEISAMSGGTYEPDECISGLFESSPLTEYIDLLHSFHSIR